MSGHEEIEEKSSAGSSNCNVVQSASEDGVDFQTYSA
jgi:hypothetical protein